MAGWQQKSVRPAFYLKKAEEAMAARLVEACDDLGTGKSIACRSAIHLSAGALTGARFLFRQALL